MATTETTVRVKFDGSTAGLDEAALKGIADMRALQKSMGDFSSSAGDAARRVSAAQDNMANATGKLRVAELKLQELYDSGKAKASQLAAAEERVAAARRNLSRATQAVSIEVEKFNRHVVDSFDKSGNDSGRSFFSKVASWVSQLGSTAAETGTSMMSNMGKAIQSNPYVAAAVVAVVAGLALVVMPALGTLLAGALVLGFGAGLAGLGLVFAAQNDKVKQEFVDLKNYVVDTMKKISAPLIPVWDAIATDARKAFDKLAPAWSDAFQKIADPLKRFFDHLFDGLSGPKVTDSVNAIATAFGKLLDSIGPQLPKWIGEIADGITHVMNAVKDNPDAVTNLIGMIFGVVRAILDFIAMLTRFYTWLTVTMPHGLVTAWNAVSDFFVSIWTHIVDFFKSIGSKIAEAFTSVIDFFKSLGSKIADAFSSVIDWFKSLPGKIGSFLSSLPKVIGDALLNALKFGANAVLQGIEWIIAEIIALPLQIGYLLGQLGKILWDAFTTAFTFAKDAVVAGAQAVFDFVTTVPGKIWDFLSSLPGLIGQLATDAWNWFLNTTTDIVNNVFSFVVSIPGRIWDGLSSLGGMIAGLASDAWNWFVNTTIDVASGIWGFVSSIPGRILDALGDLGSLLVNAGRAVISGLLNGIKAAVQGVWDFVSGIAGKIASLKGPLPYDRQLLIPAGQAIMNGLREGLMSGFGAVQTLVGGMADQLEGSFSKQMNISATGSIYGSTTLLASGPRASAFSSAGQPANGGQPINLTLDLGAGIQQRIQVQLDSQNRATARAIGMGVGASR